jgi:hypothetical protein
MDKEILERINRKENESYKDLGHSYKLLKKIKKVLNKIKKKNEKRKLWIKKCYKE